jgi:endoglucanase
MLTLTAMHVINDTNDPFYTFLQPGAYAKNKPSGTPCDVAFNCFPPHLGMAEIIAMVVAITFVGLLIIVLAAWWLILLLWGDKV